MTRTTWALAVGIFTWCGGGAAHAQSASTCAFDAGAAVVTVTVDGRQAHLAALPATGAIQLNGVPCGAATVSNTDSIQVNGGAQPDSVSLTGRFEPGLTPELDGASEIEVAVALGDGSDRVTVNLSAANNRLVFTSDGIDVGNDLDRDILLAGTERIVVDGKEGDDRIDASAYAAVTLVELIGGDGRDTLSGSQSRANILRGGEGDDTLRGGNTVDEIEGGNGDDLMFGNGGNDRFLSGDAIDGADDMRGGNGVDQVLYTARSNGVTVTKGDAQPDGEPGEGDTVRGDIEAIVGGRGADVLVGGEGNDSLSGQGGDDELYGGGGDDNLQGLGGDDLLVGDDGGDFMQGGGGNDTLDGGAGPDFLDGDNGADVLLGGRNNDVLDGGAGLDQFFGDEGDDTMVNADDRAEVVDCGDGAADNAEPDPLDTFIGCEL